MNSESPIGGGERPSVLPVVPREYHDFYRTPRFRWWHSVVALGLFVVGWALALLTVTIAAVLYEVEIERVSLGKMAEGLNTSALFLANNIGVAFAIPAAVATHRVVFGQRPGWLFSIQGRLRWGLLGRFLLVAAIVHLAVLAIWLGTMNVPDGLRIRAETWFLLTTPLQAAQVLLPPHSPSGSGVPEHGHPLRDAVARRGVLREAAGSCGWRPFGPLRG